MKKITLVATMLFGVFASGQQSFVELETSESINKSNNATLTISRVDNGRAAIIETYDVLADFATAVDDNCPDATLSLEVFDNGPAAIQGCGPTISSAGDGCFAAGEIEEGFVMTASDGTDTVSIPAGAIGNTDPLAGASVFANFTTITFDPNVYAAGFDIWNNSEPNTTVRVYGDGDALLETYDLDVAVATQVFFGFYADEPITKIELEGANASGELIGNFNYGAVCVLGLESSVLEGVSLFPNPTTDVLNIRVPNGVEVNSVNVYSVLGNKMNVVLSNNTINMSSLSRGMYLVNIETSAGTISQKVTKK
jgi:hypothetical protein